MEFGKPNLPGFPVADGAGDANETSQPNILVSKFEYSVENHFKLLDKMAILSGESEIKFDDADIQRLSSSITFLRAWREFCYQPRAIRFACETKTPQGQEKAVTAQMNLPQFSSVAVPKETPDVKKVSSPLRKDFVMYAGGDIWALDWCPKVHRSSDSDIKTEFIAIAAHPPESSYHKIGSLLSGRGLIQIWCLLNAGVKDEDAIPLLKVKSRKYSRNNEATKLDVNHNPPKRPRGRPRKNPLSESVGNMDSSDQYRQNLSVQFHENSNKLVHADDISEVTLQVIAEEETDGNSKSNRVQQPSERPRKKPMKESLNNFDCSKRYPETLPVEFLIASSQTDKIFIQTHEQIPREDNNRNQITHGEWPSIREPLISGVTETINYSLTKPGKVKARKRTGTSIANLDASKPYVQSCAVELLEHAPKLFPVDKSSLQTPKFIVEEDDCRNSDGFEAGFFLEHQSHNPNGSDLEILELSEPLECSMKPIEHVVDSSNRHNQHVHAPAANLTSDPSKIIHGNGRSIKNHEQATERDHNPIRKGYDIQYSRKSVRTSSKSRMIKCQTMIESQVNDAPAANLTSDPFKIIPGNGCSIKNHEQATERDHNPTPKGYDKQYSRKSVRTSSKSRITKCQTRIENQINDAESHILSQNCRNPFQQDPLKSTENVANHVSFESVPSGSVSDDIALPRLVMGLAHNGRVAWDVKWRPSDSNAISKHIMGYLGVLLGNGALEVWEVPHLHATKAVFSSCPKEGTDPRFLKLKPVFMCSVLKCGDTQSIPLALEWSASAPHDLILAGCHDGVVAIWKFLVNGPSKDTRPLLCFRADTVPIRALKWAPVTSNSESANIIAIAGHKGVRFWDIRDPIHPLWSIPSQKIIYSLDWLSDPRCVVFSHDDGEIIVYSLLKAACDAPVTCMRTIKTEQHGSHKLIGSSSSIWNIQASSQTGMVAYCCSDGKVIHFQLTTKAVEKDFYRNRKPHYLCGSLAEEESIITVFSPSPGVPLPLKKLSNQETRAKYKISKYQTPEEHLSVLEGRLVIAQKSRASKTNSSSKQSPKAAKTCQELVCVDVADENVKENEEVEKEVMPPKIVAMHRVRWNMNKGSDRWLCYGGAAGIVRCQEINLSTT